MKIVDFAIREIAIPFKTQFKHALAARRKTSGVVLEIITDCGIHGFGEGTPREYVTAETVSSTIEVLQRTVKKMHHLELSADDNIVKHIKELESELEDELATAPSAKCAMELALLDAYGKMRSESALYLLGEKKTSTIYYSGVISAGAPDEIKNITNALNAFGFKQAKIKASRNFQTDIETMGIVESCLGEDTELRVDANGAWDLEEAVNRIGFYCDHGVHIFEQPLPAQRREDYPRLLKKVDPVVKIILDESIFTYADAQWFIENQGASGFNLKISKLGGLIGTLAVHRLALENGIISQLGCHVGETSILTAAGITFAGLTEKLFAYEGAFGNLLLAYDLISQPLQFGPKGKYDLEMLTTRPGFGICIEPVQLESATSKTVDWINS